MLIYRIEKTDTRNGPYCKSTFSDAETLLSAHNGSDMHPGPPQSFDTQWSQISMLEQLRYHFACESIEQLFEWFDGFLDDLHEDGFVIRAYEVPDEDIMYSPKQIAFLRDNEVLKEEIQIITLTENV